MEEPSEEWEEYSPPEGSGKVSWILNKGLGLGKMIVISVIVISSAPLVLPPLVVFSAIGLAFSVPFGIFFTSYVCTEKIMSKLLSTPMPSPHSLEHGIFSSDDDEISGDAKEDMGFGEVIDFEKEEERLRKDTEERVEMRIELANKGNEGFDQEGKPTDGNNLSVEVGEPFALTREVNEENRRLKEMLGATEETDKGNVGDVKKTEKPSGSRKKKLIRKVGGPVKKKDEEISDKFEGTKERRNEGNTGFVPKLVKPVKENEGMPKRNNNNGKHDIADGHYSDSVKETTEESYKDEKIAADVDHRVSSGVTESPFGKGTTMASNKAIYSEDKTWENIRALRIILGYKVAPQATRMEELKAL